MAVRAIRARDAHLATAQHRPGLRRIQLGDRLQVAATEKIALCTPQDLLARQAQQQAHGGIDIPRDARGIDKPVTLFGRAQQQWQQVVALVELAPCSGRLVGLVLRLGNQGRLDDAQAQALAHHAAGAPGGQQAGHVQHQQLQQQRHLVHVGAPGQLAQQCQQRRQNQGAGRRQVEHRHDQRARGNGHGGIGDQLELPRFGIGHQPQAGECPDRAMEHEAGAVAPQPDPVGRQHALGTPPTPAHREPEHRDGHQAGQPGQQALGLHIPAQQGRQTDAQDETGTHGACEDPAMEPDALGLQFSVKRGGGGGQAGGCGHRTFDPV